MDHAPSVGRILIIRKAVLASLRANISETVLVLLINEQ